MIQALFAKLDWPQVVLVLGLAAAVSAIAILAPEDLRAPLASLVTALAGVLRSPIR